MHHVLLLVIAALLTVAVYGQSPDISSSSDTDIANGNAFRNITNLAYGRMQANINSRGNTGCSYDNAEVRIEWRDLPSLTRQNYTNAVRCLHSMPPQVMTADQSSTYPGIKTRHDEYVATHIMYAWNIHGTADFFAWHRAYVHFYHQDLMHHCGYVGPMPYWDWLRDFEAPQDSPIFNGQWDSMGSNGAYIDGRSDTYLGIQDVTYPPGTGGGCQESGPFMDFPVNLGPLDLPNTQNVASEYEYNPHCLIRDINPWFTQRYNSYANATDVLLKYIYIEDFQADFQGFSDTNHFGVHGGGHWGVGGTASDLRGSPADPIFFLHHAQVDRLFTIWQNLDIGNRQFIERGTSTMANSPPSAPMSLSDSLPFGFVGPDVTFGSLMDTFGGPFCYRYQ